MSVQQSADRGAAAAAVQSPDRRDDAHHAGVRCAPARGRPRRHGHAAVEELGGTFCPPLELLSPARPTSQRTASLPLIAVASFFGVHVLTAGHAADRWPLLWGALQDFLEGPKKSSDTGADTWAWCSNMTGGECNNGPSADISRAAGSLPASL